jgi:hypothetical protein
MSPDGWNYYKDFDELSRDLSDPFTKRYTPLEIIAGKGRFLTAGDILTRKKQSGQENHFTPAAQ